MVFFPNTIRTQVVYIILGVAAIVVSMHFLVLQPMIHRILLEHELDQIQSAAHTTAQTLDLEIGLAVKSLESLAEFEGLKNLNGENTNNALATYDATNPFFIYTWVMDSKGKVISAPSRPDRLGEDRSSRDYFTKATSQNPTHFQKVRISTRGRFSLVVGTIIRDRQGKKTGVLAGSLGLMDRNPQMYKTVTDSPYPPEYKIFLFSSNQILLAHSDNKLPQPSPEGLKLLKNQPFSEYLSGKDNETKTISLKGRVYFLSFDTVQNTGWRVIVQVPESILSASVKHITSKIKIMLGVLLFIVLIFSLALADRLVQSLSRLTDALNAYGERGENQTVEENDKGEVNEAIKAFNKMLRGRKEVENQLQQSERKFRSLLYQASDAFFLHDLNGKILDVNQRACESLGFSRQELISMSVNDIDADSIPKDFQKNVWLKLQPDSPVTVEGTHKKKDGTTFPVEVNIGVFIIDDEKNILALVRDISDRKKAEEELRQAQKMEAIGNLAGGIAHDFNNILTAIFGNIELALLDIDKSSQLSEKLKSIKQSSVRAKNLIDQILTFSRKAEMEKKPLRVDIVLKETIKLLRSSIPATIAINENIEPNTSMLGDPTELHQIIMNLCTNAYHSMLENGGTLNITLKKVDITSDDIAAGLKLEQGRFLLLEISDTGGGMDYRVINKIFEPYFTTKGSGRGTGLGLAVVHGIVKSYSGHINVQSELGQGTTFQVFLPAIEVDVDAEEALSGDEKLEGGNECIMYVDDEEKNVAVVQEILNKFGYTVDIFTNGVQAWQDLQRSPEKYDLVITDMTMPFMTGVELARKVREIRPNLPIILCTGYNENINQEKTTAMGINGFIQKPITINELLNSVRNVLDKNKNQGTQDPVIAALESDM